jgi:hypothetical protein
VKWSEVMMNSTIKRTKCREKNALITLPLLDVPCNRKERKKRIAHHLPCICFGSTQYRIATLQESKLSQSYNTKKHARKLQHLRFGKPTIGELTLSDKHKKLDNKSQRVKNSESLLLICQKIEHVKNIQKNGKWRVEKPSGSAPFRLTFPAFPAREEFVFRNRYRNLKKLPSEKELP